MCKTRRFLALSAAVALAVAGAFIAAPAQAANGPYLIMSDLSNLCLDVPGGSHADGVRIQQWRCHAGTPERWRLQYVNDGSPTAYFRLVNVNSGKCLDILNGNRTPGAPVEQWPCWGGVGGYMQQWQQIQHSPHSVQYRNRATGQCMDVRDWSTAPGGAVQQWHCSSAVVQKWTLFEI